MSLVSRSTDGPVAVVTLDNPGKKNPLSVAVLDELLAQLRAAEIEGARVVVLRGAGDSFCAGYNLDPDSRADYAGVNGIADDVAQLQRLADRLKALRNSPLPLVAQVHGHCLAGGTDLVFASDIAVAASTARIGLPNVRSLGISLLSTLWPLTLGPMRSKMMMFTGDWISGTQAEAWGLVALAVPPDELDEAVMKLARRIARVPPQLLRSVKRATNRAFDAAGFEQLVDAAVEIDAIAHFTEPVVSFWKGARAEGLKNALKRREAAFEGNALMDVLARSSRNQE